MSGKSQLDGDSQREKRAAVVQALQADAPHTRIAREHGLSRHTVDRFAKHLKANGSGNGKPLNLSRWQPPAELHGEGIDELKRGPLPWTYRLIGEFYDCDNQAVADAHGEYQRKVEEENGTATRKRKIEQVAQEIVGLRGQRRRVALTGTPKEHRQATTRVEEAEREHARLEAAQAQWEMQEEAARFRDPAQRRQGLEKGLAGIAAEIEKPHLEAERLLSEAMKAFEQASALVGVAHTAQHALNRLGGPVQNPAVMFPATTFADFVQAWLKKGESKP